MSNARNKYTPSDADIQALAESLQGITWTRSQLILQAHDFLLSKGVRRPSPATTQNIASLLDNKLTQLAAF